MDQSVNFSEFLLKLKKKKKKHLHIFLELHFNCVRTFTVIMVLCFNTTKLREAQRTFIVSSVRREITFNSRVLFSCLNDHIDS